VAIPAKSLSRVLLTLVTPILRIWAPMAKPAGTFPVAPPLWAHLDEAATNARLVMTHRADA